VTGTMEGGVSHGVYCPGDSPTPGEKGEVHLSPFRWLDVVLSLPSHQVRRCGEIGGGRYVTVGLLLARAVAKLVVLVLRLGREVRHSGGGEQVQATGCIAQVGLFSQKGAGGCQITGCIAQTGAPPSPIVMQLVKLQPGRVREGAAAGAGRFKHGAVQARGGAVQALRGAALRGAALSGKHCVGRGGPAGEALRGAVQCSRAV